MKKILIIIALLFLTHCSTQKLYTPLDKNQIDAHFNLGGPLFVLSGIPLFMPFAYLGLDYGINNKLSLAADLPLTLYFFKNAALDISGTYFFTKKIALKAELLGVWDITQSKAKLWPMLSGWSVLHISQNWLIMPGFNLIFQETTPAIIASPTITFVKTFKQWNINFAIDYLMPYAKKTDYNLDYISPGLGGFALNFGFGKRL